MQTGVLSGVLADDVGRPIDRALVWLVSIDSTFMRNAVSADDGRFEFANVPAASFRLTASKPGYANGEFGRRRPNQPGVVIRLAAGERRALSMTMPRTAVVSGTLFSERGEPAAGMSVVVGRWLEMADRRVLVGVSTATTDDRGEFRCFAIQPGSYIVMTGPPLGLRTDFRQRRSDGEEQKLMYSPVYFPGVTSPSDATPIALAPGEERRISLVVRLVETTRLEYVLTTQDGAPLTRTSQFWGPEGSTYREGLATMEVTLTTSRRTVDLVPAGRYAILASGTTAPAPVPVQVTDDLWGSTVVAIDGRTPASVTLMLEPGIDVTGRVVADDPSATAIDFKKVTIDFKPQSGPFATSWSPIAVKTEADGTFARNIPPATHLLRVTPPEGWAVKSATMDGRDISDLVFEPPRRLGNGFLITLTRQVTELSGRLVGRDGNPSFESAVVAFPADERYWIPGSRRVRLAQPDTDGQFVLRGLPPGEYLVATADIGPDEAAEPATLAGLRASALRVTLAEGEKRAVTIRVK